MSQNESWYTLRAEAEASLTERKSEFIAHASPVHTAEQALDFVATIRKHCPDARHNAYAYLLREGNTSRFSDDGEPHGTAGMPVLDVLRGEGLTDAAVVVTRYFGGVLLGTGGLVRAYSQAAKRAISAAGRIEMQRLCVFLLCISYKDLNRIEGVLENLPLKRLDAVYENNVRLTLAVRETDFPALSDAISERAGGRAKIEFLENRYDVLV